MRWNLRMRAAQIGIWKSNELRRQLSEAGMDISAGKMSALWTGQPTSVRLDDLDVICTVLACTPAELLICEPEQVAARRRTQGIPAQDAPRPVAPRLGRGRTLPPV